MKNSFLRPKPIGQPAEEQRAQHRTGEIGAADNSDIGVGEAQDRAVLQCAGQRARERHFEAVENPGDAERGDHQRMEPAPGQAVEPRRDVGFDHIAHVGMRSPYQGRNPNQSLSGRFPKNLALCCGRKRPAG